MTSCMYFVCLYMTSLQESNRLVAQRDNAIQEQRKNRVAPKTESNKRQRAEESQEQRENRLAAQRDNAKRKRAEESQEHCENSLVAQREITKKIVEEKIV